MDSWLDAYAAMREDVDMTKYLQADRARVEKQLAAAQARIAELEASYTERALCCGNYTNCLRPCTPRGRWLAGEELRHRIVEAEPAQTIVVCCGVIAAFDALYKAAHDVCEMVDYELINTGQYRRLGAATDAAQKTLAQLCEACPAPNEACDDAAAALRKEKGEEK